MKTENTNTKTRYRIISKQRKRNVRENGNQVNREDEPNKLFKVITSIQKC